MEWPHLGELERAFGEFPAGTTVLDWIEPGMTERAARDLVENVNEQTESGYTDIAYALVSAERFADNTRDWTLIAKAWMEKLQNPEEARRCMREAEDAIDIPHDWILIAKAWKEYFSDLQAAIRCMVHELGVLTGPALTDISSWQRDCESDRKKGYCAEHYSFTLSEPGEVTIALTADEEDAVHGLYLISGDTFTGEVIEEAQSEVVNDNDDFDEPYTLLPYQAKPEQWSVYGRSNVGPGNRFQDRDILEQLRLRPSCPPGSVLPPTVSAPNRWKRDNCCSARTCGDSAPAGVESRC